MKSSIVLLLTAAFIYIQISAASSSEGGNTASQDVYTFDVETPANLEVQLAGGQIQVQSHDRNEIRVEKYLEGRAAEDHNLNIEVNKVGNTVFVKVENENRTFNWFSGRNPKISFKIFVPAETSGNLQTSGGSIAIQGINGDTEMRTSGGSLSINRVIGHVTARTSGGPITVGQTEGVLSARTSGGPIKISGFTGELDCRTSGGSISLTDVNGKIAGRTSGGSITANNLNYIDSLDLRTSGGNVSVTIPDKLNLDLDLRGSRVRTNLNNFSGTSERNKVEGKVNGGGIPISLRTSGGVIDLKYE
ncbi:MAG: DUF4097 family beta strand repeat-containing protein [Balneolales bacterium]